MCFLKRCILFVAFIGAAPALSETRPPELFEVADPFPDDESIQEVKKCYPDLAVEDVERLRNIAHISYLERPILAGEEAAPYCVAHNVGTSFTERSVNIRLRALSLESINKRTAAHSTDYCEDRRSFGSAKLKSVRPKQLVVTTTARYRARDCGHVLGVEYKNNLYIWEGELDFVFELQDVFDGLHCSTPGPTCRVIAHKFMPPRVNQRTTYEKKYRLSAVLTPEGLAITLGAGLIGGPGAAAFAAGMVATIGYDYRINEVKDQEEKRMVRSASSTTTELVSVLVTNDLLRSLSSAVDELTDELETVGSNYAFDGARSAFVEGPAGEFTYRISDIGQYCSDQDESMRRLRHNIVSLLDDFSHGDSQTIEIEEGDILWRLAEERFGDGKAFLYIAQLNHLSDPNALKPGDSIVMPSRSHVCATHNGGSLVLRGTTLSELVHRSFPSERQDYARFTTFSGDPDLVYPFETIAIDK